MPKEDDDIIELTEIVEEEEGEEDDFMKELSDDSFLTASEAPSSDSDIEGDDEVSAFFSSGGADLAEPEAPAKGGPEPETAASPEEKASEDFDSFLVDLEDDLQQEQDASRPRETAPSEPEESLLEEPEEELQIEPEPETEEEAFLNQNDIDDLEKQWAQALDETSSDVTEIEPEAEVAELDEAAALNDLSLPVEADQAANMGTFPAINQQDLEETLERVVRGVLEPIAERVFAEVAQQIIAREIDRLKKDIEGLEE